MSKIDMSKFEIAPKDQGQLIEKSWAQCDGGFVRRFVDRSAGKIEYRFYPLSEEGERREFEFYAINGSPIEQGLATKDGAYELTEEQAASPL